MDSARPIGPEVHAAPARRPERRVIAGRFVRLEPLDAAVHGPAPQGPFLAALGLFQRTDRLARTQPPLRAAALVQAAQRLAEPDRMGRLFKAVALCHPALSTPPGFEA